MSLDRAGFLLWVSGSCVSRMGNCELRCRQVRLPAAHVINADALLLTLGAIPKSPHRVSGALWVL